MRYLDDDGGPIFTNRYGGKAIGIWELREFGLPVPATVALEIGEASDFTADQSREVLSMLGLRLESMQGLAVRSSSASEDNELTSGAGRFESRLVPSALLRGPEDVAAEIRAVGHQRNMDIGVVIQPLIDAAYGGAAFGLDVRNHSRGRFTFTWVEGSASAMLAGEEVGHEAWLDVDSNDVDSLPQDLHGIWRDVYKALTVIQSTRGFPVDLEWIQPRNHVLVQFVQCRRVVLPAPSTTDLSDGPALASIPSSIRAHPKIRIREAAAAVGVRCSPGLLYVESVKPRAASAREQLEVRSGSAVSVVLLYPRTVGGQVLRTFVGRDGTAVDLLVRECHRYAIRSYPSTIDVRGNSRRHSAFWAQALMAHGNRSNGGVAIPADWNGSNGL